MLGTYLLKLRGLLLKDITGKKQESTNKRQLNILNLDRTAVRLSDVLLCLEKKKNKKPEQQFSMKNSHTCMSQSHKQDNIRRLQKLRPLVDTEH